MKRLYTEMLVIRISGTREEALTINNGNLKGTDNSYSGFTIWKSSRLGYLFSA